MPGVFTISAVTGKEKKTERETGREKEVTRRNEIKRIPSRGRKRNYCFHKDNSKILIGEYER